jgi:hypothetical protein
MGINQCSPVYTVISVLVYYTAGGQDSSVGLVVRYEVDGPRIESQLDERVFPFRVGRPQGYPTHSTMDARSYSEVKSAEAWLCHPAFL